MKLIEGHINTLYKVSAIIDCEEKNHLYEHGIMEGEEVKILNKSPFKGPFLLEVNNSKLAIRAKEASFISISE